MKRDHEHDGGLGHDLEVMASMTNRRTVLRLLAGATLVPLFGCSDDSSDTTGGTDGGTSSGTDGGTTTTPGTCSKIPEETAGPYPGDGSNGVNALTQSGIVRSDIRSSVGTSTTKAEGIPLTVTLQLVNTNASSAALAGYVVYLWHCDRDGNYSLYSSAVKSENYLRGVQEAEASGTVTFTTIFPAAYSGRWPHIHFEVYPSLDKATASSNTIATSQLALPKAACDAVYATTGYDASIGNLAQEPRDGQRLPRRHLPPARDRDGRRHERLRGHADSGRRRLTPSRAFALGAAPWGASSEAPKAPELRAVVDRRAATV